MKMRGWEERRRSVGGGVVKSEHPPITSSLTIIPFSDLILIAFQNSRLKPP